MVSQEPRTILILPEVHAALTAEVERTGGGDVWWADRLRLEALEVVWSEA